MTTATMTSKGQLTIPVSVRAALRLASGDRIGFTKTASGHYEISAANQDVTQLRGMIKTDRCVSVEEMNAAIAEKAQM